jgi:hypothetical protein
MEPVLAQALSTLIGAITTAILMASAYYWGPRQRQVREDEREHRAEWKLTRTIARKSDRKAADSDRRSRAPPGRASLQAGRWSKPC